MNQNHKSKLLLGFEKQCKRQDAKPNKVKIELPIAIQLPKNFKGKYKYSMTVSNSKWNGMNLKNLRRDLVPTPKNSFNSYIHFDSNGMHRLSMRGKNILRKKKHK